MRQRVPIPLFEVNKHFVVGLAADVDLGNHVNAIHCTQIHTLNHIVQLFAGYALEHARDADAGLAGFGFLDLLLLVLLLLFLVLWLLVLWLLVLWLLVLWLLVLLFLLSENVRRIGENFRLV